MTNYQYIIINTDKLITIYLSYCGTSAKIQFYLQIAIIPTYIGSSTNLED